MLSSISYEGNRDERFVDTTRDGNSCAIAQGCTVKHLASRVLIITTCVPGSVSIQNKLAAQAPADGPPLQETLLWLKEKLATNVRVSKCLDAGSTRHSVEPSAENCWTYFITKIEPLDFASCTITMNFKTTSYKTFVNSHGNETTIKNTERLVNLPLYKTTTRDW
jgi:hypothetical protein